LARQNAEHRKVFGKQKKPRVAAALVLNSGSQIPKLLSIMFIFVDSLARAVLFLVELFLLAFGQMTVMSGHVGLLLVLDILLPIFHARCLSRGHGTALDPTRDAVLLVLLAGVNFVNAEDGRDRLHLVPQAGCVAVLGLSRGGANQH
jgi:hypothetical protein